MSPASRSKSTDRNAAKETPKGSPKSSSHVSPSAGTPSSGYNPLLGTYESAPIPSTSPQHVNDRFRNIDDTDDHSANGVEYDTASNNGSWSGESEDHKEKTSHSIPRPESVPGANNEKREKIRQKNERKHQRQKERRAQELHDKCCGYLMSRKLEALAHQLVAMGFSHERATMALILNEGRVEESVSWLFECNDEDKKREQNVDGGGTLKIDISEELAHIAKLETKFQASKQEVERAIVASEGDLDKADEALKERKQEPPAVSPRPDETIDPSIVVPGVKLPIPMALINPNAVKVNLKSFPPTILQQRKDDRDFNYTKCPVALTGSSVDTGTKNIQASKKIPPKPQNIIIPTDKRWTYDNPSVSYSSASPLQASPPPAKVEARFIGNELKSLQPGSLREPVIVMQRPKSINGKQLPSSNVSSSSPPNWYSNSNVETVKANGSVPPVSVSRSTSHNGVSLNPLYSQHHYQSQPFVSSNSSIDSQCVNNGSWNRGGTSPTTIAPASNLGLFCRLGANGSSGSNSPVDWSTGGSMMQFDYASIDWSLDLGSLTSKSNSWWRTNGSNHSMQNNTRTFDSFSYGLGMQSGMRPVLSNRNGVPFSGLQDDVAASSEASGSVSREWTSPFEEKDIFSLHRQFVSSPTL